MKNYDYILIGTGQATGTILAELKSQDRSIAVIESDRVGGTCVNWGCTPTKTLIASARAAHMVRRGEDFGVTVKGFSIDFSKVMKRVNSIRNSNSEGFESWLNKNFDFYRGRASFLDDHKIQINGDVLRGERILIHTGTEARAPAVPGADRVPWMDNRKILDLKEIPDHLIVYGGSYIGLEFAQAFIRLGARVSLLQRSGRILSREDEDMALAVQEILESEGIEIHCGVTVQSLEPENSSVEVHYEQNGESRILKGSHLLAALGREPAVDGLNLEAAGVTLDSRGFIQTNVSLQTAVPHIYALGDVNGRGAFTHTSVHDGQVFLSGLKGGGLKSSDRIPIHSLFTDPPLARVGMTENQARGTDHKVLMATRKMNRISRALEKDETSGLIKLLVDQDTDLILGAAILGIGGDEIIGMLAVAMQAGLSFREIQKTVLPHPTVSELIPWIFQDLTPLHED